MSRINSCLRKEARISAHGLARMKNLRRNATNFQVRRRVRAVSNRTKFAPHINYKNRVGKGHMSFCNSYFVEHTSLKLTDFMEFDTLYS